MRVGVIGVQGDVSEHVDAVARAMKEYGAVGEAVAVRRREGLDRVDGLTIPGGESTTISKLLVKLDLFDEIVRRAREESMPILGTCAGCILLAKDGRRRAHEARPGLRGPRRGAGARRGCARQREPFGAPLAVGGLPRPVQGVFIRAPAIVRTWGECRALARHEDKIVLARQGCLIGAAFHPELSNDFRIHRWFLELL